MLIRILLVMVPWGLQEQIVDCKIFKEKNIASSMLL